MSSARDTAIRVRDRARAIAATVTMAATRREVASVKRGIATYKARSASDSDLYLLRRNAHMLEKGLTMRPRRSTFAVDYIEATVRSFATVSTTQPDDATPGEISWVYDVLAEYFSATRESSDAAIGRARDEFTSLPATSDGSAGPHHPIAPSSEHDIDDLESIARGRRSVRWYEPRSVPRELVDRAIAIGMESPTACNRQPYRWELFDDPDSVKQVVEIPMGTRGYRHQITGVIVVIGDLSAFFDERDRHLIYIDSCLATMGVIYGLEAQGISSCCINWPDIPSREARMRDLLGLKHHEKVIMLVAYGYADPAGLVPFSAKKPLSDVRSYRTLDRALT